ncbi:MAG: cytochrome c peroxidase [Acetobacteraceae bacterium]|nr:cytochrome c peroxidase [Acetobacteraceae bacterium]
MVPRLACLLLLFATVWAGLASADEAGLPWPATPSPAAAYARAAAITALGRDLFFDPGLSASGRVACATCHDPRFGFSPANAQPVQPGGRALDQPGTRAVPGLSYAQFSPFFTEHYFESEEDGDESIDNGPTGGLTWDGRASRARDQARVPLLAPHEMANASPAEVVAHVRAAPYAEVVRALYGPAVFDRDDRAFDAITEALETFQQDPATFAPFSSKYDAWLNGRATLSAAEAHGLTLFEDQAKGNCAHCHKSRPTASGALPLFTDFGFVALGVPRNPAIQANADPAHFDLGLCGPDRTDLAGHPDYCGLFKAPSLRNVAVRKSFFHNGAMHSLRDAVAFYASRDTDPGRWYPRDAAGHVRKFDDLPAAYWENVNVEPPFDRHPGDPPALTDAEIDDIVAFLGTLTDGWKPEDKVAP